VQLRNIAKGELDLGELEDDKSDGKSDDPEQDKADTSELTEKIAGILGDKVEGVRISRRLTDSPACLVVGEHELGVQMRRILEAAGQPVPDSKPVLEINPDHPLLSKFSDGGDSAIEDLAWVVYRQALILSGDDLDNPGEFIRQLNRLLIA